MDPTTGKILVIDDDPGMRGLLEVLLDSVEISSLVASNRQSALQQLSDHRDQITGCLLDLNLEDCQGEDLYDELVAIAPNIAFFPMSGCFDEEIRERLGKRKIAGVISKPFRAMELLETIRNGIS